MRDKIALVIPARRQRAIAASASRQPLTAGETDFAQKPYGR